MITYCVNKDKIKGVVTMPHTHTTITYTNIILDKNLYMYNLISTNF